MAADLVSYEREGSVATITMDDGKRNALSPRMLAALNAALDRAEAEEVAVVLTGRSEVFSAGFDLKVLRSGSPDALRMLGAGYGMTARLLAFPKPVVAASPGHAFAMGAFLLLASDYRLGVPGAYQYAANEVAIGLPMPRVGAPLLRLRLTPSSFQRAAVLAESFAPEPAREAGFLDRIVAADELHSAALSTAHKLLELDMPAHVFTKRRVRKQSIHTIRLGIPADLGDAVMVGAKQWWKSSRATA